MLRRRLTVVPMALVAALMLALAGPAESRTRTTFEQTILDRDRDNRLEPAPGDPYVPREDLGQPPTSSRPSDRKELLFFGQFTDTHVVDEESPLRVEFLDRFDRPFTSAYRPQEGLSPHVVNEMTRQIWNTVSPVTSKQVELFMTTGDNTDNTQCNETRWMIDLMDGNRVIDPDSGLTAETQADLEAARLEDCDESERFPAPDPRDEPDLSGFPAGTFPGPLQPNAPHACPTGTGERRYQGVRDRNEYYEPDSSTTPGADNVDGDGYSPDQNENEREAQRTNSVRDFPGLFQDMQDPFKTHGVMGKPWFGIFGNHDGLIQGNQPRNGAYEAFAMGCVKPRDFSDPVAAKAFIETLAEGGFTALERGQVFDYVLRDVVGQDTDDLTSPLIVSPDPRRRPLRKSEYIAEHFQTTGQPPGHGFKADNVATGMGNYSIKPEQEAYCATRRSDPRCNDPGDPQQYCAQPGRAQEAFCKTRLRFIVLDSIAENGGDGGNIDHPQFQWIHDELLDAERKGELVLLFAHHSLRTMSQPQFSPPFLPGDTGGDQISPVHFGLGPTGEPGTPCRAPNTPPPSRLAPPTLDETLRCLLLRHPSAIAFVNGHEHQNRITPFERDPGTGRAAGGFWEINTAAHIDWPEQSRVLDVIDNLDGNLSIVTTMIDHTAGPNPGGAPCDQRPTAGPFSQDDDVGCDTSTGDGRGAAGRSVDRLASISRELSFNDPDASNGEDGRGDARGAPEDRNAKLFVRNPYPLAAP